VGREGEGIKWGGEGRGVEGSRGEGKGEVVPNVRDALTPLAAIVRHHILLELLIFPRKITLPTIHFKTNVNNILRLN